MYLSDCRTERKSIFRSRRLVLVFGVAIAAFLAILGAWSESPSAFTAAAAAPPPAKTALIQGDTVSGGAGSQEAQAAAAQGYMVTVVSNTTWQSMTAAQFGAYDLLIVGDPTCNVTSQAAAANAAVWAPVVMGTAGGKSLAGNRVLIGTDPVFHDSGSYLSARATIIRTGIEFAGKQPGRTGLYFDASCSGGGGAILAALNLLSTGSGVWTNNDGPPCGGSVSLIASEPSFASLTTASLQGWGCSVHEAWPTFKSDWSALAVATDTATKPTCGVDPNTGISACGQAYILIAGSSIVVSSGSISVSPLDATNPVGTSHTVAAHVTSGGSPIVGQVVTFTVTGQNAAAVGACVPAGCITDSNGDVSFTYTGTNGVGDDTIKASFTDATGSLQAATAQKHWTNADADGDGILDDADNCPTTPNADQADLDGDGIGDVCDDDMDGDGIVNSADNCPSTPNPDQADADNDGIGDTCDPDDDNDGVADRADQCPGTPSGTRVNAAGCPDADGDGVADAADNCPINANPDQADSDHDGRGDVCDACPNDAANDADGDGRCADVDNCPLVANADQADLNGDGVGDACTPYSFPAGGAFVIGNLVDQAGGASAYFWGSHWAQNNSMSGGDGPKAFKGFENGSGVPACGSSWTSQPGNSSVPPASVPEFMGVIVSDSVQKSGSAVTGNISRILVVRTNSGYGPAPGLAGTGEIIAVVCSTP